MLSINGSYVTSNVAPALAQCPFVPNGIVYLFSVTESNTIQMISYDSEGSGYDGASWALVGEVVLTDGTVVPTASTPAVSVVGTTMYLAWIYPPVDGIGTVGLASQTVPVSGGGLKADGWKPISVGAVQTLASMGLAIIAAGTMTPEITLFYVFPSGGQNQVAAGYGSISSGQVTWSYLDTIYGLNDKFDAQATLGVTAGVVNDLATVVYPGTSGTLNWLSISPSKVITGNSEVRPQGRTAKAGGVPGMATFNGTNPKTKKDDDLAVLVYPGSGSPHQLYQTYNQNDNWEGNFEIDETATTNVGVGTAITLDTDAALILAVYPTNAPATGVPANALGVAFTVQS